MDVSPLVQQERPQIFQPKIVHLYEGLLRPNGEDPSETEGDGFWREFFLLKPDRDRLKQILDALSSSDLLHLQHETQAFFARAVQQAKVAQAPMEENALETLAIFLNAILDKRYTNPSADMITVLAGLDEVDSVMNEFASVVENVLRIGQTDDLRSKAIRVALSLTSGAYQTSLISYFTYRDLFSSLMKCIRETKNTALILDAFVLLTLLANYNRFETRNVYRVHLEDYVNEKAIQQVIYAIRDSLSTSRDQYVALQEDVVGGWTFGSTLSYVGLGALAPSRPATPNTPIKLADKVEDFGSLPDHTTTVLLGIYDFANANKIFCANLIMLERENQSRESPLSAFLSLTSYLLHHAYRSTRATTYGLLSLLVLRVLVEDLSLCKLLCDPERTLTVRLCRQRQPFLPLTTKPRPSCAAILDICIDTINHNLRRNLDLPLYISAIGLIHRLIAYLVFTRTRLAFHWTLLWQTLLSFVKFLTTYASSVLHHSTEVRELLKSLLETMAVAVIAGESFLPDPASYDDLFYKLVESGAALNKFKDTYKAPIAALNASPQDAATQTDTAAIDVILQVSNHYQDLVHTAREQGRLGNNPSPREVSKIIRQGYETLSLPPLGGLDRWDRFREGESRNLLKRAARVVVDDAKIALTRS